MLCKKKLDVSAALFLSGLKSETEEDHVKPVKPPMTDAEFHNFLDAVGHMVRPEEFRLSVYLGGVEPSLRSVVWRHLLNIYPDGFTGRERFQYLKRKSNEYFKLRDDWRQLFSSGKGTEEIKFITNMVKKDVLRTDRSHQFYAGADDNTNVLSLFNILVTFALTHPDVSYCQGMSDIASPLLVVQKDEANAYICLCGLMMKLRSNFLLDGLAITVKLQHLALLLQHRDPEFYMYLKKHDAHDMFFCYRWLLLEMKREFPFDDALRMLEVMWSSLPPDPPENEIALTNSDYSPSRLTSSPISPSLANHAHMYLRLRALRRQASSNLKAQKESGDNERQGGTATPCKQNLKPTPSPLAVTPAEERDIDPEEYLPIEDKATQELQDKSSSIDRSLETLETPPILSKTSPLIPSQQEDSKTITASLSPASPSTKRVQLQGSHSTGPEKENMAAKNSNGLDKTKEQMKAQAVSDDEEDDEDTLFSQTCLHQGEDNSTKVAPSSSCNNLAPLGSPKRPTEIPVKPVYTPNITKEGQQHNVEEKPESDVLVTTENGVTEKTMDIIELNSCEEAMENPSIDFIRTSFTLPKLPPPDEFGYGNPFLLFLCLTLLMQQRDHIIHNKMDYNDLAMHFDKLVRRHHVNRVLHQAQSLYAVYLRSQAQAAQQDSSSGSEDVSV